MNSKMSGIGKISALLFLLLYLLVIPAAAGTPDAICNWAGSPVNIDGNLDEWKGMPTTFFEEERLVLGISSDSNFLFLFFRTDNIDLIRTIRMTGLKLWLDPRGKKSKDLEFHFRGGPSMEELAKAGLIDTSRFAGQTGDRMPPMFQRKDMTDKMTLTDKKLDLELDIPTDGSQGPTVQYALEHGFCIFEFAVPLQDHLVDYYGFNAGPGQKIRIGVQWGDRPERGARGDGRPGDMLSGGRGGGRGGMDGRMQMPKEKEVWVRMVLALPAIDQE